MRKLSQIFLGCLVGGLCASMAHASTTSYSSDSVVLPNEVDTTVHLAKFNTSLGILTGVYVEIGVNLTGAQVQLDNDDAAAQTGTGRVVNAARSLTSDVGLLKTDFTTINNGNLSINASHNFALGATSGDAVGTFNATGLSDYANWQPGTLNAHGAGNISSLVWDQYKGSGTFGITTNALYLTSATFAGSNGFFQGNTPNGQFYASVTYTYDPVPETSALPLLGAGAFGLACVRRRRK